MKTIGAEIKNKLRRSGRKLELKAASIELLVSVGTTDHEAICVNSH